MLRDADRTPLKRVNTTWMALEIRALVRGQLRNAYKSVKMDTQSLMITTSITVSFSSYICSFCCREKLAFATELFKNHIEKVITDSSDWEMNSLQHITLYMMNSLQRLLSVQVQCWNVPILNLSTNIRWPKCSWSLVNCCSIVVI